MAKDITLERLDEHMDFFCKMYDAVRLVDPLEKVVIEYRGSQRRKTDDICYDYWGQGKICDNCISMRAHLEQKCYMKLEQSSEEIMFVTAMPVEGAAKPTVVELLKHATDTMMIGEGVYTQGKMMRSFVSDLNCQAVRDDLTGIYNRRFVNERLSADMVRALLEGAPLSVIFLDVDNLKGINDTFGHPCGDEILVKVAQAVQECIREDIDWAARYGGDEFLVCLGRTGEEAALKVAGRIQERIGKISLPEGGGGGKPSVSMGVGAMAEGGMTAEEIIALADQRMYESKKRAR